DLARGRLLVERRRQLAIARLELLEQPDVLDRDHGLVGEGLQQRNLLLGERAHLRAANGDGADRAAVADERYGELGAPGSTGGQRVVWKLAQRLRRADVVQVNHPRLDNGVPNAALLRARDR